MIEKKKGGKQVYRNIQELTFTCCANFVKGIVEPAAPSSKIVVSILMESNLANSHCWVFKSLGFFFKCFQFSSWLTLLSLELESALALKSISWNELDVFDMFLQYGVMQNDFTTHLFDEMEGFFLLRVTSITYLSVMLVVLGVCKGPLTLLSTCVALPFKILDLKTNLTDRKRIFGVTLDFEERGSFPWSCSPLLVRNVIFFWGLSKLVGTSSQQNLSIGCLSIWILTSH